MSVLILGGTGFIGSRVARKLATSGEKVICMDLFPDRSRLEGLGERVTVVQGDIVHMEDILLAIKKHSVDTLINMAYMLGQPSEDNPHAALWVNVMGMSNCFEAARMCGVNKVLYASSIACHGPQTSFGERQVTEEDNCYPTLVYGATKQLNEFMARKYASAYGMTAVGVRVAVVIGAGRRAGNIAPTMLAALPAGGQPVVVPFRPSQGVLLIHVDDVAKAFVSLCKAERIRHPIYHTGGHTCTFSDEADIVRSFIRDAQISFAARPTDLPLVYLVDGSRLQTEFGFRLTPLEASILDVINSTRHAAGLPPLA